MPQIYRTETFDKWLTSLKDIRTRAQIETRIDRLSDGNPGDVKPVGKGVSEMRIHYGPGYRVYFKRHKGVDILLLAGGGKHSQARDIETALRIAEHYE